MLTVEQNSINKISKRSNTIPILKNSQSQCPPHSLSKSIILSNKDEQESIVSISPSPSSEPTPAMRSLHLELSSSEKQKQLKQKPDKKIEPLRVSNMHDVTIMFCLYEDHYWFFVVIVVHLHCLFSSNLVIYS